MRVPKVRDRVLVAGLEGVFRVIAVDEQRGVADLARVDAVGFLSEVPVEDLRPAEEPERGHRVDSGPRPKI